MPCGGIRPIYGSEPRETEGNCFTCGRPCDGFDLFVIEWDATLHYRCLPEFLNSREGKIVINHGHAIEAYGREVLEEEYKADKS